MNNPSFCAIMKLDKSESSNLESMLMICAIWFGDLERCFACLARIIIRLN